MEGLKELRNLTAEERGNEELLRSRVDQQSELICILKKRADQYLEKCMRQEETIAERDETVARLNARSGGDLRNIKSKDGEIAVLQFQVNQLKNENDQLKKKNAVMSDEMKRLLKTDEQTKYDIEFLKEENAELKSIECRFNDLLEEHRKVQESSREKQNTLSANVADLSQKVDELSSNNQKLNEKVSMLEGTIFDQQKQIKDENCRYKEVESQRKTLHIANVKLTSETQTLLKRQDGLKRENDVLRSTMKMNNKMQEEPSDVRQLRKKLSQLEAKFSIKEMEFCAYKKHMSDLLDKERNVSASLLKLKSLT